MQWQVSLAAPLLSVPGVLLAHRGCREMLVPLGLRGRLGQQVESENKEFKVFKVFREFRVPKAKKVIPELRVPKV